MIFMIKKKKKKICDKIRSVMRATDIQKQLIMCKWDMRLSKPKHLS